MRGPLRWSHPGTMIAFQHSLISKSIWIVRYHKPHAHTLYKHEREERQVGKYLDLLNPTLERDKSPCLFIKDDQWITNNV